MRISPILIAGGVALAAMAAPAGAQHTTTTVTKVHGPLKVLPHHKNKICRTHYYHHRRTTKCYYH